MKASCIIYLLLVCLTAPSVMAQCEAERNAVDKLIDEYAETEAAMDMHAQARLMTENRIHITSLGRMTAHAMNMEMQQAQYDALKAYLPGMRLYVDARDRMIDFYGGCDVAVASFTWHVIPVPTGETTPEQFEIMQSMGVPPPLLLTTVLEVQDGTWKIAHTQATRLGQ